MAILLSLVNSSLLISRISSIIAFLAGLLILVSGYNSRSFLLTILDLVKENVIYKLPFIANITILIAINILTVIISLGGFTVIAGAFALFYKHLAIGRFLIGIGAGTSFTAMLISFLYTLITIGLSGILLHLSYWVGIALAVISRRLARKAMR